MKDLLPSLLMAICVISVIFVWETAPPEEGTVLVIFPQDEHTDQLGTLLRQADASLIGASTIPGGFLVSSEAAGLPARLRQQGALFVLDANPGLGCKLPAEQTSTFRPLQTSS